MTLKTKAVLLALTLALIAFLLVRERRGEIVPVSSGRAAEVLSTTESQGVSPAAPSGELEVPPADTDRTAIEVDMPAPAGERPEPFGSLRLHAAWSDGTPAPGVSVLLLPLASGIPVLQALEAATDAGGDVLFERVPAGAVQVWLDRGFPRSTRVEVGLESRLEFSIGRGVDLSGIVVDEFDQPVPGAEVVSSEPFDSWSLGRSFVVARTRANGTFEVRSAPEVITLGARARGHAPSLRRMVSGTEGGTVSVRLVLLGAGGSITGIVLDPRGEPLEGALVVVGSEGTGRQVERTLASGTNLEGMPPARLVLRTDAAGQFLAIGVEPGLVPVGIRARGYATWRDEVEVSEGARVEIEAWMMEGVDVVGRVNDGEGRPALADVRVGDDLGPLGSWTVTGADGAFRLDDLEPGEILLKAEGNEGRASIVLRGAAGDRLSWEARLGKAGSLRGRLVDENGTGLAGWTLEVMDVTHEAETDFQQVETGEDGRFVADDLHERPHRVEIYGPGSWLFPSLVLQEVPFEQGETVFEVDSSRFPSVRIACSIRGEDGRPVTDVRITTLSSEGGSAPVLTPELDGRFEIGPLPPGEWSLSLQAEGVPPCLLGPRSLGANETWDAGEIRLGAAGFTLP